MNLINRILGITRTLEIAASVIAGVALLLIMFVVCFDVAGRYIFNSPLSWSYDLISLYLMGVSFFFALSDTLRRRHHVNVDILFNLFSKRTQIFWNAVGWSLSSVLFCIIVVLAAKTAYSDWAAKNVIDGAVSWPTWVSAAIASIGMFLICVRLVLGAIAYVIAFVTGEPRKCAAAMDPPAAPGAEHAS